MSLEARQALVALENSKLFFQNPTQKSDLLDPEKTDSNLIALIQHLINDGHLIEFTAIRSDHHDDGPKGHAGGLAFDSWPLASAVAGNYLDAGQSDFVKYIQSMARFPGMYQLGLAGSADTHYNETVANINWMADRAPYVFSDSGGDHVHAGVSPA